MVTGPNEGESEGQNENTLILNGIGALNELTLSKKRRLKFNR
jgi:hypothetical protein